MIIQEKSGEVKPEPGESAFHHDQLLPERQLPPAPLHGYCAMGIKPEVLQQLAYLPCMQPVRRRVDAARIVVEDGGEHPPLWRNSERQYHRSVSKYSFVRTEGEKAEVSHLPLHPTLYFQSKR